MKETIFIISLVFLSNIVSIAQLKFIPVPNTSKFIEGDNLSIENKVVKLGMSLGFVYIPIQLYDATISPIDNTLKLDRQFPVNFLISSALVVNPFGKNKQDDDSEKKIISKILACLKDVSFIASINLIQLGATNTTIFNKKIDGGLGLGIKLSDNFHVSCTAEMLSIRQLRGFITNYYKDKSILVNEQNLVALDFNDNKFFVDRYILCGCLKFIYIIANKDNN